MTDTAALTDWIPIQHAGPDGGPIDLMVRSKIIMRLQDGLLVARAKRVARRLRSRTGEPNEVREGLRSQALQDAGPSPEAVIVTHETDVALPAELWSSDRLGFFDHAFWTEGDQRLTDLSTIDDEYDGDHSTYYGIELREASDTSGQRAGNDEVVSWCVDWLAKRRAEGLRTGENLAWAEFRKVARHIGLTRDDVFRPAFRAAKSGKR